MSMSSYQPTIFFPAKNSESKTKVQYLQKEDLFVI